MKKHGKITRTVAVLLSFFTLFSVFGIVNVGAATTDSVASGASLKKAPSSPNGYKAVTNKTSGVDSKSGLKKGSKKLLDILGINPDTYLQWLDSHDSDSNNANYYIGTRYSPLSGDGGDYRNPKGDTYIRGEKSKNGKTYYWGYGHESYTNSNHTGMVCSGFVWHVLYASANGGVAGGKENSGSFTTCTNIRHTTNNNTEPLIPNNCQFVTKTGVVIPEMLYYSIGNRGGLKEGAEFDASVDYDHPTGWYPFYRQYDVERYYFKTKSEMLNSGVLQKGDIIYQYLSGDESKGNGQDHIGIFYGNSSSDDKLWHSCYITKDNKIVQNGNDITTIKAKGTTKLYVVIKAASYIKLQLNKTSANEDITGEGTNSDGTNKCYSYSGARYNIYLSKEAAENASAADDKNTKDYFGYIVTDKNGYGKYGAGTNGANVPLRTYYVKEVVSPPGYELDPNVYEFKNTGKTADNVPIYKPNTDKYFSALKETPSNDPMRLNVRKKDTETGNIINLPNAEFTIKYYDGFYESASAISSKETRSWVIKTDGNGIARLDEEHFVSGDEFYYKTSEEIVVPLGTVTVQETKAPKGYQLNDDIFVGQITEDGYKWISGGGVVDNAADEATITIEETPSPPETGNLHIYKKITDENGNPIDAGNYDYSDADSTDASGFYFRVTNKNYTDSNGKPGTFDKVYGPTDRNGNIYITGLNVGIYDVYEITDRCDNGSLQSANTWQYFSFVKDDGTVIGYGSESWVKSVNVTPSSSEGIEVDYDEINFENSSNATPITIKKATTDPDGEKANVKFVIQKMNHFDAQIWADLGTVDENTGVITFSPEDDPEGEDGAAFESPITVYTDEDGCIDLNLYVYGKEIYKVTEYPSNKYEPEDGSYTKYIVADKNNPGRTVIFKNKPVDGEIIVIKSSDDGVVDGFTFRADGYVNGKKISALSNITATTNADGQARIAGLPVYWNQQPVTYHLSEELTAEQLKEYIQPDPQEVTFASSGGYSTTITVHMYNPRQPAGLWLKKVSRDENVGHNLPLSGAEFTLYQYNADEEKTALNVRKITSDETAALKDKYGALSSSYNIYILDENGTDTITTPESGMVALLDLEYGETYALRETKVPDGYTFENGAVYEKTFEVDWSGMISATSDLAQELQNVINIPEKGSIEFRKISGQGASIGNIGFKLYRDKACKNQVTEDFYGNAIGDEDGIVYSLSDPSDLNFGMVKFADVRCGVYYITEVANANNAMYKVLDDTIVATVTVNGTTLTWLNSGDNVEQLKDGEAYESEYCVVNDNITIFTTAIDKHTGTHDAYSFTDNIIIDTVHYEGLVSGREYTLKAVVMNKETGKAVQKDGKDVTATKTFTPTNSNDEVDVEIPLDASNLGDQSIVIYEYLYCEIYRNGQQPIAEHTDINDEKQTINVHGVGNVKFVKTNESGNPLAGVTFKIYSDKDYTTAASDCSGKAFSPITTDKSGIVEFNDLLYGTYYIAETQTENGKQLLTDTIKAVVSKDGTVLTYSSSGELLDTDTDGTSVVYNNDITELPITGGIGVWVTTAIALLLLAAGGAVMLSKRKNGGKA